MNDNASVAAARARRHRRRNNEFVLLMLGGLAALAFLIGVPWFIISKLTSSDEPSEKEAQLSASQAVEDRRFGRQCLSAWDGSNSNLVSAVKSTLRNPSSFEHIKTITAPADLDG